MHFVGRADRTDPVAQREACLSIVRQGFRFTRQQLSFVMTIGAQSAVYTTPAVCFTDIPLRLAQGHVARYGKCAIGVRKSLVKRWGGNPVLYLVDRVEADIVRPEHERTDLRGVFGAHIAYLARGMLLPDELPEGHWIRSLSEEQRSQFKSEVGWVLSHVKELFDLGADVDSEDDADVARRDRYYMEREWRVCLHRAHFATADHEKGSRLVKRIEDSLYLPFSKRSDIRVIITPNDTVRGEIAEALCADGWTASELPTLVTFDDSREL